LRGGATPSSRREASSDTHLTPRPDRLANCAGHSALGYDLLALVILRLLWRWLNPVPEPGTSLRPHAGRVAHRLGGRDGRSALAAVVLVHVVGALRHHLVKRNDVLRRMTWGMRA
jgi:cytochrome b561